MAVWADIGEDDENTNLESNQLTRTTYYTAHHVPLNKEANAVKDYETVAGECVSAQSIAHALRCYPIAEKLASFLDLTDLSSLSMTCRSMNEALTQFAYQLKQHTLQCTYDVGDQEPEAEEDEMTAIHTAFDVDLNISRQIFNGGSFPVSMYPQAPASGGFNSSLGLSGKTSPCARDLVSPCRKCGTIVCRNCTEKSTTNRYVKNRLRRLCDACLEATLVDHMQPLYNAEDYSLPTSSSSSTRSGRSTSTSSNDSEPAYSGEAPEKTEVPLMFLRTPCSCATKGVYLCQTCGHNVRAADDIYRRVWSWRSRYSTHLGGGLGTGLGLGNQGQKCGRGKYCLATKDAMALMETECSEDELQNLTPGEGSRASTPLAYDGEGNNLRHKPGYLRQEIEGIGGVVKSKSKKLVKVGATVYEFRDERESGKYLEREVTGTLRSWCSWCSRVCPGEQDALEMQKVFGSRHFQNHLVLQRPSV